MAEGRFQPPPNAARYRLLPGQNFLTLDATHHTFTLATQLSLSPLFGRVIFQLELSLVFLSLFGVSHRGPFATDYQQVLRRGIVKKSSEFRT